jgi:phosphatidylserine decarboxylase
MSEPTESGAGSDVGARAFAALQYALPKHLLSRLVHKVTRSRAVRLKNALLRGFLRNYRVDMSEALQADPFAYPSFNEFFTRALRPEARPIAAGQCELASPVDGTVSQCGSITADQLFQAKGHYYSLEELLAGDRAAAARYRAGSFACIYLAPYNYHRIHMPCSARLRSTTYVPGDLFSVNSMTVRTVPRVFARNERVICEFETVVGAMALIPVGALFVGSMEMVHCGEVNPPSQRRGAPVPIQTGAGAHFAKGAELGRFNMGSTVILLFQPGCVAWHRELRPLSTVRMGQSIAELRVQAPPDTVHLAPRPESSVGP